jgi:hypothetical protein
MLAPNDPEGRDRWMESGSDRKQERQRQMWGGGEMSVKEFSIYITACSSSFPFSPFKLKAKRFAYSSGKSLAISECCCEYFFHCSVKNKCYYQLLYLNKD